MTRSLGRARFIAALFSPLLISCQESPPPTAKKASELAVTPEPAAPEAIDKKYCQLPTQAPDPGAGFSEFSDFAWRQFVALNWPVLADQRGQPNCDAHLGDGDPTVWESYKTTSEIFFPDARDPGPWNTGLGAERILTQAAKADAKLPVEEQIAQAVGGWLIDQRGKPAYYSISVDKTSYDYVVTNGYYNAEVVSAAPKIAFPSGALEVKASWKILTDADDPARYHRMQARVATFDDNGQPTGDTEAATVGLVGMHIVYKAEGFPQWTWATFEQIDNVDPHQGHASFYNADCSGDYCTPNISPKTSGQPFTMPNQITRITPILPTVAEVNTTWQAKVAGTPWQYYQLISPQWPTDPNDPGNPQGSPTPGVVANVTMESYIQSTSSCMDCHSTARVPGGRVKSDYSFIFLFAKTPTSS